MKQQMCWPIVWLLLLMPSVGLAYHPETGHAPLLRTAINQYLQCQPTSRLLGDTAAPARVLQGNIAMDQGLGFSLRDRVMVQHDDVLRLSKRLLHWHFYHPDRQVLAKVGWIDQSMLGLWQQLNLGWAANAALHDKLLFVGGLAHLIEDLTVPAHVIPVYHGPTAVSLEGPRRLRSLVDYYLEARPDTGLLINDAIDSWPVDEARLQRDLAADPALCQRIRTPTLALKPDAAEREQAQPTAVLDRLRDDTARQTLALLAQVIPNCPGVRWQDFWQVPKEGQYFGRYALQQPLFGEAGVVQGAGGARCRMQAADARYHTLVAQLHLQAVQADLVLLGWFERQL